MAVKDDGDVCLETFGILAPCMVQLVHDLQPLAGLGFGHQFFDGLQGVKHHALTGAGDMREQTVLDWVVLGGVGRVMGDADFHAHTFHQLLQVFL